jgi:diguanylate cyclase (GGDEF)-like protein
MLQAGAVGTLAQLIAVAYALGTWSEPRRGVILAASGSAVAVSLLVLVSARRLVAGSRWRRPLIFGMTFLNVAAVGAAALAAGGGSSPPALGFIVPVVFISISMPPRLMVPSTAFVIATYVAVAALGGPMAPGFAAVYVGGMITIAAACAVQARTVARQRAELRRLSRTDPLTGLVNRRGFEERLAAEIAHADRSAFPLALLVLDLDRFKEINDTEGHAVGDELLRWVAKIARATVREHDVVGRLGGDEFAVVLPETSKRQAQAVARRLAGRLAGRAPASIGVAVWPADGPSAEDLHRCADRRLYAEKAERVRSGQALSDRPPPRPARQESA